ncbi:MAG TPA: dienelactone hydrolase family protein [Polyangiaceae bacterium]|nr:dienelactone hydrolase family protein [Polyangiaceae bacterium]
MTVKAISRRTALLAALGCAASACRTHNAATNTDTDTDHTAADAGSEPLGGLQFATGGELGEHDRGGTTVVLLHGYGASADDLISLVRAMAQPHARYIVPAGPLELPNGGRAWWPMRGHPSYDSDQVLAAPAQKLESARVAVQGLLSTIAERFAPEALFLVGFSQGAMLALDVALIEAARVNRVAVLSGALLADAASRIAAARHMRPAVFVSHGREDPVLCFEGAQRLVDALTARDFSVTFRPFDGGHEIPPATAEDLKDFLFGLGQ